MALGSCSTAASCSRLVDENGPASSTGGRGQASTWQLQLSHWAVRASTDEQRTGYALGVAIVQTAQRSSHDVVSVMLCTPPAHASKCPSSRTTGQPHAIQYITVHQMNHASVAQIPPKQNSMRFSSVISVTMNVRLGVRCWRKPCQSAKRL